MGRQSVSPYVGVSSNGKTSSSNLENVGSIPTTLANLYRSKECQILIYYVQNI